MNTYILAMVKVACMTGLVFLLLVLVFVVNREVVFSRLVFGIGALGCGMVVVVAAVFALASLAESENQVERAEEPTTLLQFPRNRRPARNSPPPGS